MLKFARWCTGADAHVALVQLIPLKDHVAAGAVTATQNQQRLLFWTTNPPLPGAA